MKIFKQFLMENINLINDPKWFKIAWNALEEDTVVEQQGKVFPDPDEEFEQYYHVFDSENAAREYKYGD